MHHFLLSADLGSACFFVHVEPMSMFPCWRQVGAVTSLAMSCKFVTQVPASPPASIATNQGWQAPRCRHHHASLLTSVRYRRSRRSSLLATLLVPTRSRAALWFRSVEGKRGAAQLLVGAAPGKQNPFLRPWLAFTWPRPRFACGVGFQRFTCDNVDRVSERLGV